MMKIVVDARRGHCGIEHGAEGKELESITELRKQMETVRDQLARSPSAADARRQNTHAANPWAGGVSLPFDFYLLTSHSLRTDFCLLQNRNFTMACTRRE